MKRIILFLVLGLLAASFPTGWETAAAAGGHETFIRLHPHGPPGKGMTGDEKEKEHVYYASDDEKISAGVWEAQPQTAPSSEYHTPSYTEFMYILEGSVTLEDKSGREDTFKAGDAVIVPKGVAFKWKQSEYIRKYWVIFDADPSSATEEP
jgi:uncharacterized cupin superfamily protein